MLASVSDAANPIQVTQNDDEIRIKTPQLHAAVRKRGYVSGVAGGSFVDRRPASTTRASGSTSWTG